MTDAVARITAVHSPAVPPGTWKGRVRPGSDLPQPDDRREHQDVGQQEDHRRGSEHRELQANSRYTEGIHKATLTQYQ